MVIMDLYHLFSCFENLDFLIFLCYLSIYLSIYIYRERERERERAIYIYIYIDIYIIFVGNWHGDTSSYPGRDW